MSEVDASVTRISHVAPASGSLKQEYFRWIDRLEIELHCVRITGGAYEPALNPILPKERRANIGSLASASARISHSPFCASPVWCSSTARLRQQGVDEAKITCCRDTNPF